MSLSAEIPPKSRQQELFFEVSTGQQAGKAEIDTAPMKQPPVSAVLPQKGKRLIIDGQNSTPHLPAMPQMPVENRNCQTPSTFHGDTFSQDSICLKQGDAEIDTAPMPMTPASDASPAPLSDLKTKPKGKTAPDGAKPSRGTMKTIRDVHSGKEVQATPEEVQAVQPLLRILLEELNYPNAHIAAHPQYRIKKSPSSTKRDYPLDIVVFDDDKHKEEGVYIVCECKQTQVKKGRAQLENYMSLSSATLGVWFNGRDFLYLKKTATPKGFVFTEITGLPKYQEKLEDIGCWRKKDLIAPVSLRPVLTTMRTRMAVHASGVTRDQDIAKQLILLLFCKMLDEKETETDAPVQFRVAERDTPADVKARIQTLLKAAKNAYPSIFRDLQASFTIDAGTLAFCVGVLQRYAILNAKRDVIADAFEVCIGESLKGEMGQFFTPRNVIQIAIELVRPQKNWRILDPSCGTAGFLVEALRSIWDSVDREAKKKGWSSHLIETEKQQVAQHCIFGLEKDTFLSQVSKAYMALIGDGKSGIFCVNTLLEDTWEPAAKTQIGDGAFDLVLMNPPYGKNLLVRDENVLGSFELGHEWDKASQSPSEKLCDAEQIQVLFIERAVRFLKEGGKAVIIVPESILHSPSNWKVIAFLRNHGTITAVVDLPHDTFRPYCNAKCAMFVFEKNAKPRGISMIYLQNIGHNHRGEPVYQQGVEQRPENIVEDTKGVINEIHQGEKDGTFCKFIEAAVIDKTNILIPRYYFAATETPDFATISLGELVDKGEVSLWNGDGSPASEAKGEGDIPYIRVKDIVNLEAYVDPTSMIPESVYQENTKKRFKVGDVMFVSRGSYRIGSVGMVSPKIERALFTREILGMRVNSETNMHSNYYLLWALNHPFTQRQVPNKVFIDTTLPAIGDRWREIRLPVMTLKDRGIIAEQVKSLIEERWAADSKIAALYK